MLPGFPELLFYREDTRFVVQYNDARLTFYTERSAGRDLKQISEVIAGATDAIPLIIAPYTPALAVLFSSERRFVFLAPASLGDVVPDDERLITNAEGLSRFINAVHEEDNFVMYIPPQWQSLTASVAEAAQAVLAQAAVRLKTIRHFGRLWPINFRLNLPALQSIPDIKELRLRPDILALAGPSLSQLNRDQRHSCIWCADTALPVLLAQEMYPAAIFTLDAGYASREHFCGCLEFIQSHAPALITDPLAAPAVLRLPFGAKYTYASSHPLVQEWSMSARTDLTQISNPEGNVGGLMLAVCAKLFPNAKPKIFGYDRGHQKYVTHARGTAYYRRMEFMRHRLNLMEGYSFKLSRRYGAAV